MPEIILEIDGETAELLDRIANAPEDPAFLVEIAKAEPQEMERFLRLNELEDDEIGQQLLAASHARCESKERRSLESYEEYRDVSRRNKEELIVNLTYLFIGGVLGAIISYFLEELKQEEERTKQINELSIRAKETQQGSAATSASSDMTQAIEGYAQEATSTTTEGYAQGASSTETGSQGASSTETGSQGETRARKSY